MVTEWPDYRFILFDLDIAWTYNKVVNNKLLGEPQLGLRGRQAVDPSNLIWIMPA